MEKKKYYENKIAELQEKKKHVEDYYKKGINTIISFYKEKLKEYDRLQLNQKYKVHPAGMAKCNKCGEKFYVEADSIGNHYCNNYKENLKQVGKECSKNHIELQEEGFIGCPDCKEYFSND